MNLIAWILLIFEWKFPVEWGFWPFNLAYYFLVIVTIVVILLENRDPVKTVSWMLVMLTIPYFGFVLYLYFGRNFRKTKIFNRKEISDIESTRLLNPDQIAEIPKYPPFNSYKIQEKRQIIKLLFKNSKSLLTQNNRIEIYENGFDTFESIKNELKLAKHHINLEYYIFEDDEIGNEIKDILIERSKAGVQVRVIYDDVGSWNLKNEFLDELKYSGVKAYCFMPVKTYTFANKINYRNHRKIIVVDGKVGFVGGMNIADRYIKGIKELGYWRDTHLKLEGDAVQSLQAVFLIDWYFVSKELVNSNDFFPEHKIRKKCLVQITASGPDSDYASIMQTYFKAIATAREYVYISSPYFLPNEAISTAMQTAALGGIDVRLIIPEKNDSFLARWSSRSYIQNLLEAGVKVYFYKKGFNHGKILLVDGVMSSVGTANMDIRSFDQNFEVNAIVYNEEITNILTQQFYKDLQHSSVINIAVFKRRPVKNKLLESFARLFSPLL